MSTTAADPNKKRKNAARIAMRRQREARIRAERGLAIFAPEAGRPPPPFISVLEFGQAFGVSHATAHRWLKPDDESGEPPLGESVKVRGRRQHMRRDTGNL